MPTGELVDVTNFARGFPSIANPEINRDHLLESIDDIFRTSKIDILLIDGEEGIGKTSLLSQFAKRHYQNSLSLFLRPASRAAIEPAYIAGVLAEQLHWILYGEALHQEVVSELDLQGYFALLDRRLHRTKKTCFVIVDGLQDPELLKQFVDSVIRDLLPFGMPSYRYLITGTGDGIGTRFHRSLRTRPYNVPFCSLDEAIRYLDGLKLDRSRIDDLYKLCKRNFGKLSTVRRLIQSGVEPSKLLDEAPPDFLELEWTAISGADNIVHDALRIMAFAQSAYNSRQLADITGHPIEQITAAIESVSCLAFDRTTGDISFCSDAHRRFVQRKYASSREDTLARLIDHHSNASTETDVGSPLPHYLGEARRFRELLAFLNTQHFLNVAEATQSLTALQRVTHQGIETSTALDDSGAITGFTALASFLVALPTGEASRAEIEARVRLGDKELAKVLAQRASLKEDRLTLLVTTAAALKKHLKERDEAVMAQIVSLIEQINFVDIEERAIAIASELVSVDPDLAFQIVQRSTPTQDGTASLDASFARLTIHAIDRKDRATAIATAEKSRIKVKDPAVQEFLQSISLFLETTSASDVVKHAESLEPLRALFFLRQWAEVTTAYGEAGAVLDFALDLLIKTTAYTPQIRDLRELATPLSKLTDSAALERLIKRFDSQRATVMDLGTNEDLTRLQLQLAASEARLEPSKAHHRLLEVYWQVSDVRDLSVRAACLSWMVSHYSDIDLDSALEHREGLFTVLSNDLNNTLHELFRITADHFEVAKAALRALSRKDARQAISIATSINTLVRRDDACLEIIRSACRPVLGSSGIADLYTAIDQIADPDVKDEAISILVEAFCKAPLEFKSDFVSTATRLSGYCKNISHSLVRAKHLAMLYARVRKQAPAEHSSLQADLLAGVERAWSAIDAAWRKANLAFDIAKILSAVDETTARLYIARGEEVRKEATIASESQVDEYLALARLTVRAFSGLLPTRAEDPSTVQTVAKVIDVIPAHVERAVLWANLACRAHLADRQDLCETFLAKHVRPLIELISSDNLGARWRAEIETAPASYAAHQGTALERLAKLPPQVQEDAAIAIANFVLRRIAPGDSYPPQRTTNHRLKYERLVDLFTVLRLIRTDSTLYHYVRQLARYLLSKRGRAELTKQNVADLTDRIEREILPRLPDGVNIKHEGYVLACLTHIGKLRSYNADKWHELLVRAENLPNVADKTYVTILIAGGMASRFSARAEELFRSAKTIIDSSNVAADRMDRLEAMAEEVMEINSNLAKECVRSAYTFACDDPEGDLASRRRDLIDLANTIDPEFAESLVGVIDDDPRRARAKRETKEHLQTLELEKALTGKDLDLEKMRKHRQGLGQAAWRSLGLLNADWSDPLHSDDLRPYVTSCAELPLYGASFPVLAWVIGNQLRRNAKTPVARNIFLNLFNSLAQASESAIAIIARTSGGLGQALPPRLRAISDDIAKSSVVIGPGDRDQALAFLSNWAKNAGQYIKICDQYFTVEDLDVVRLIRSENPTAKIVVLTSKFRQPKQVDLEDFYIQSWRKNVSPHLPGDCDIVVVGTADDGEFPIHDRWWIAKAAGLRVGTSYNSLGLAKSSEISILRDEEVGPLTQEIDEILQRVKREHRGRRLSLSVIAL